MGGSRNWISSLIYHKKPVNDEEKLGDKRSKKKWNLWRTSSQSFTYSSSREGLKTRSSYAASSFGSEPPSFSADEAFTAAVAAVIRAPPRDFLMVKREWAATRIQAAFRAFLARQAFRALKAVVRIQAIFRGRQVRKQAAVTLRCMQALVRVQSRVRAHRKANLNAQDSELNDSAKQAEKNWCASPRSVKEVKTKLQMRQEGAIKRERAMVYALTHQSRRCPSPSSRASRQGVSMVKHNGSCKNSPGWGWHDQRVATKPCDGHLKEEVAALSRKNESSVSEHETVHVRKNNLTSTRVFARPPHVLSRTSSESLHDETSSSSTSLSPVPFSGSIFEDDGYYRKPSYMSLTQCTQAKTTKSSSSSQTAVEKKQLMTCNDGSDSSCNQWSDLYPPGTVTGRHLWAKSQRS